MAENFTFWAFCDIILPAKMRGSMIIEELLKKGFEELEYIDEGVLKTRMLLSDVLECHKEYLITHNNDKVDSKSKKKFLKGIERLKAGEPIQYVLEKTEFYGLELYVNKNVLIPQPDTEILVGEILENYSKKKEILDLCTGSGAIAISLKKNLKNAKVLASDISPKALRVAKKNIENHKLDIPLIKSNLFENIYKKFDIIVSNPPYIETDFLRKLPSEVKYEPVLALDGGKDGLDFYRNIIKESKEHLKKNGILALEIGFDQREAVTKLMNQEGYKDVYSKKDYGGNDRIVVGKV